MIWLVLLLEKKRKVDGGVIVSEERENLNWEMFNNADDWDCGNCFIFYEVFKEFLLW